MKSKITVTGANIVFLIVLVACLLFSIIIEFVEVFDRGFADKNFYLISLIIQYVIILIPVVAYMLIKGLNIRETFRFKSLDPVAAVLIAVISVPAAFTAIMFNTIVLYLLQFIGNIPPDPVPVPTDIKGLIEGILVVAVSPAICEELLNRGLILRAYENRGSLKAVAISAVFFGFFHFDLTNLLGPIFLGLLIGYYAIKTNSIFAGMLAHFLNNALSELYSYFWERNQPVNDTITITWGDFLTTVIWGITGLIAVLILLKIFRKVTSGSYRLVPAISDIKNDVISIVSHWPIILIIFLYITLSALFFLK